MKLDYRKQLMISVAYLVFGLLIFFALIGCKSTHTTTDHKTQIDTVYIDKEIVITKNVKQELKINDLCDSLGLKEIEQVFVQGETKFKVVTKDNYIYIEYNQDSIKKEGVKEYKSSIKDTSKLTEIVKYRTPFWVYKVIGVLLLVILLLVCWIFRKRIIPFVPI